MGFPGLLESNAELGAAFPLVERFIRFEDVGAGRWRSGGLEVLDEEIFVLVPSSVGGRHDDVVPVVPGHDAQRNRGPFLAPPGGAHRNLVAAVLGGEPVHGEEIRTQLKN